MVKLSCENQYEIHNEMFWELKLLIRIWLDRGGITGITGMAGTVSTVPLLHQSNNFLSILCDSLLQHRIFLLK